MSKPWVPAGTRRASSGTSRKAWRSHRSPSAHRFNQQRCVGKERVLGESILWVGSNREVDTGSLDQILIADWKFNTLALPIGLPMGPRALCCRVYTSLYK